MPTVLRIGAYRFYFYSHEPNEPAHVHIDKGNATAKIWLHDISVARSVALLRTNFVNYNVWLKNIR
ncbi:MULTISPECIES: DUF4160 domain-containing protein [unclassified Tatumella]|uniref:DUF4160 domain-containing protein n=1 Tax=unclassified Tatumella TaxID=2649542 RepID=UPI00201351ED|nr:MULTISPECIES: DUF4160 domain-containing protein [unclassified Tatumella]